MTRRVETIKLLKSELRKLLETTRELDSKLTTHEPEKLNASTSEEDLIVVGYYLSGIYSNLEDMFEKVARQFENKIEDTTQWHIELLNRMALEIENIRPALLSESSFKTLDELRRFRHVFRFSYTFELDWERMLLTVRRWNEQKQLVYRDIERFIEKLDELTD